MFDYQRVPSKVAIFHSYIEIVDLVSKIDGGFTIKIVDFPVTVSLPEGKETSHLMLKNC